jgi:hypothetical protein
MSSSKAPADPRAAQWTDDGKSITFLGDKWDFEKKLGSGRFASVYSLKCSNNSAKQKIAAKVTTLAGISSWARAQLGEELAIWRTLNHPNVVRMHGHLTDATRHVLLLELARGGELFERIVSMSFFSEQLAARQISEVLSALDYLHSFGVLHRDLKPENLLLESEEDDARVKVADFGASKLVISTGAKTPCGSLGYAAPEQLRGLKFAQDVSFVPTYDKEVDLWSVGVITYILLSGSMPFDPSSYSAESLQKSDALEFPASLFGEISPEALDFIRALLQVDPAKRLTAAAALRHAWLLNSVEGAAEAAAAAQAAAEAAEAAADRDAAAAAAAAAEARAAAARTMPPPTPKTPGGRALTPLMTPGRLKALRESGALKNGWARAAEKGKADPATGAPAAPEIGNEGDTARELAKKRTAEELDEGAEIPTLMLPPEVSKRIRKAASDSASSAASSATGTREQL